MGLPGTPSVTLDAFTQNNGTALSAAWTNTIKSSNSSILEIQSNRVSNPSGSTRGGAYWNAAQYADAEAGFTMPIAIAGGQFEIARPYVRIQNPGGGSLNAYWALWFTGTGDLRLRKTVADSESDIGQVVTAYSVGDKLAVQAIGTTIKAFVFHGGVWVEAISVTDSSVTGAGYIGFELTQAANAIDDFFGGLVSSIAKNIGGVSEGESGMVLGRGTPTAPATGFLTQPSEISSSPRIGRRRVVGRASLPPGVKEIPQPRVRLKISHLG